MKSVDYLLDNISKNFKYNRELIIKCFGDANYRDSLGNSLLHLVMKANKPEEAKLLALYSLKAISADFSVRDRMGENFIQTGIRAGCSHALIKEALKVAVTNTNFNINNVSDLRETILHVAITKYQNYNDLEDLVNILCEYRFDFNAISMSTINNYMNQAFGNDSEGIHVKNKIELLRAKPISFNPRDSKQNKSYVTKTFGKIMTDKIFFSPPAIARDEEVSNVILSLAQEKKMPIIVGPSGVGKTTVVDQLAYLIQCDEVPTFLQGRQILEVSLNNLISDTKYRGDLEKRMQELLETCMRNNYILFIDEIHQVFNAGSSREDSFDIARILQGFIDRDGLKVIGTTTDTEYEKYFANGAFKRRFDVIRVDEPKQEVLYEIVRDAFIQFANKKEVSLDEITPYLDDIIMILIDLTDNRHRTYYDKLCNPDLIISLIDRAFAHAIVYSNGTLNMDNIVFSIMHEERLYDYSKNKAVQDLNEMHTDTHKLKLTKIIDFNEVKKNIRV